MKREKWNEEFIKVAKDWGYAGVDPDDACWDEYVKQGLSPVEAMIEDLRNA